MGCKCLKNIFSIKNAQHGYGKDITILGLKFNIDTSKIYKPIIKKTKIINNKIIFSNFSNKSYGCNPKYIAEEIIRQKLPYELVWVVKNPKKERKNFPKEIKLIKSGTLSEIKEHASAKVWISNTRKNSLITKGLYKKNGQIYIQTWHGSLGIKKAERAAENLSEQYIRIAKQDSQMTDFYISNSLFEDEAFSKNFWYNGEILKLGHARNDIFFISNKERDKILNKIYSLYSINPNNKLILYVPTFRDKDNKYNIDLNKIISELNNDNNSNHTVLTRLHPNIAKKSKNTFKYSKNIIDVTNYADIQELLLVTDILITDYSSCIFDYMLSEKPAFIFAPDLDDYNTERGFLYPLNSTPFLISKTTDELIKNIKTFDYENYKIKVDEFLKEKGCIDDGYSSRRFVEFIKNTMSEDKWKTTE